jgi:hypothetical protein
MKYKIAEIIVLILFTLLGTGRETFSQTTPCDIKLKDGKQLHNMRMMGLNDNLLLVADTGRYKIINIDKVYGVSFVKGTYMWTGAAIGAATGFLGGIAYYSIFNGAKKNNFLPKDPTMGTIFIFTIPGAIIGALIGMLFRNIDDYDVSQLNAFTKSKELKFIMKDHEIY